MKVLLFVFGLCAYVSGSYAPLGLYGGAYGYHGAQHLPVIGPNGVPLEPPANVAARVQHAAAVVEAKARNGDLLGHGLAGLGYAGAYSHGISGLAANGLVGPLGLAGLGAHGLAGWGGHGLAGLGGHGVYLGPQHLPVIGPNGVPLEPAANVAARAQHAHAVAEAQARNGDLLGHGLIGHGLLGHAGVIGPLGVPLEPAANVAARALHAAAHAQAAHGLYRKRRSLAWAVPAAAHGIPVIGPNGVPLELPANVAARAQHAVAVANAQAGQIGAAHGIHGVYGANLIGAGYGAPWIGAGHGLGIAPLAINGVPQDTHEVAAAKVAHAVAHAEANARNGVLGGHAGILGLSGHNLLGLSHGVY